MIFKAACVIFIGVVSGLAINAGYDDYYAQKGEYNLVAQPVPKSVEKEQKQDFSKIPGRAGIDYPLYHSVPHTSFSCHDVPALPGMYANVETGCQAYHICHDGREGEQGSSFLCTNGTLFNQKEFSCDWWYNVDCHAARNLYKLNLDPKKNPYLQKPKKEYQEPEDPEQGVFIIKY